MIFIKKTSNAINFIIFTMLFSGVFYPAEKVFALSGLVEVHEDGSSEDIAVSCDPRPPSLIDGDHEAEWATPLGGGACDSPGESADTWKIKRTPKK